jgi:hypothetical protein
VAPGEGQGELVGQQFVIGEPLAGRGLGREVARLFRSVHVAQRRGETWPISLEAIVVPLRELGHEVKRGFDAAGEKPGRKVGGQRVDGFDER